MTVILSQVSFWINKESVPARTVFGKSTQHNSPPHNAYFLISSFRARAPFCTTESAQMRLKGNINNG